MWQTRFVIFGLGRTGSNLLIHLLRSHPDIHCDGEIFNRAAWPGGWRLASPIVRRMPYGYLRIRSALQQRHSTRSTYGCKIPFATRASSLGRLHRDGWKVILIQRTSIFDQTLSWCVAHLTARFQHGAGAETGPIEVPLALFDRELVRRRGAAALSTDLLQGIPHLTVTYEEDLQRADLWPGTSQRICDFLSVDPRTFETSFARTWQKPYRDVVTNYDVLARRAEASGGLRGDADERKYHH